MVGSTSGDDSDADDAAASVADPPWSCPSAHSEASWSPRSTPGAQQCGTASDFGTVSVASIEVVPYVAANRSVASGREKYAHTSSAPV